MPRQVSCGSGWLGRLGVELSEFAGPGERGMAGRWCLGGQRWDGGSRLLAS
jgi:hypothetical protein